MNYQAAFQELEKTFTFLIPLSEIPIIRMLSKLGINVLKKEVMRVAQKPVKNMIMIYLKNQEKAITTKEGESGSTSTNTNQEKNIDPKKEDKKENNLDLTTPLTVAAGGVGLGAGAGIFSVLSDIPKVLTNPLVLGAAVLIFMNKK